MVVLYAESGCFCGLFFLGDEVVGRSEVVLFLAERFVLAVLGAVVEEADPTEQIFHCHWHGDFGHFSHLLDGSDRQRWMKILSAPLYAE